MARPYVTLSVATSIDGYIDDTSDQRLMLSNDADFDRVDQVRAESDAILIGAGTIRADNPRLLVKSDERRAGRISRGEAEYPLKVTVTASGKLDRDLKFWHYGGDKLVYTAQGRASEVEENLTGLADVVGLPEPIDFGRILDDLGRRGVRTLMVEGGGQIHTAFLSAGLADEIHMVIAPILVGAEAAPRFLYPATYPAPDRLRLIEARQIGDVVLLRYDPKRAAGTRG